MKFKDVKTKQCSCKHVHLKLCIGMKFYDKNIEVWIGSDSMERLHRKERVAAILKVLSDNPNVIFSLGYFSEIFDSARSTLSEDITIVKKVVENLKCGVVETLPGAAGGVKYVPGISREEEEEFISRLCDMIKTSDRIIPGGFLYMNDIIYSPEISSKIGIIMAQYFRDKNPDYVLTIETKGIPIAMMTAKALNIPLVIIRSDNRVTEGSTVSINYISGSSKRMRTMSLSKRSVKKGSRCIFIDDFMRAGGTANGVIELMKEFDCSVEGIGVLVESLPYNKRLVQNYVSLMNLESIDEEKGEVKIHPSMRK
ncbi:pur operon repressor [Fervidicella metallireducens]